MVIRSPDIVADFAVPDTELVREITEFIGDAVVATIPDSTRSE
jgi:hypothetical protein